MSSHKSSFYDRAPPEAERFVFEVSRRNEEVGFSILGGQVDGIWAEYLDDGWPFATLGALVAKSASHLRGHWIWGGNDNGVGDGVIPIPVNSKCSSQYSHLSMFNVDRDRVIVTVQPNHVSLDRIMQSPFGSTIHAMFSERGEWVHVYDIETKRSRYTSRLLTEVMGISGSVLQANALAWRDAVVPEDQSIFDEMVSGLRENRPWKGELGLILKSGDIQYFQYICSRQEGRGSTTVIGMFIDSTSRRSMQDKQAADEETLRELLQAVEQSKEGFSLTDAEGNFIYVNSEHLRMFGFDDRSQVIGQSWSILYEDEVQKRILEEVFSSIKANGSWRGVFLGRRRDGSRFPQDVTLSVLSGGGFACNSRDITADKVMADKIAHSENYFRGFAEHMPAAVTMRNAEGYYLFINRFALQKYPEVYTDAIGRHAADVLGKEMWAEVSAFDQAAIQSGAAVDYRREVILEGVTHYLEGIIFPQFDAAGGLDLICAVWDDVTARKQQQQETEKAVTLQLQLIGMQRDFVAMVSHEFRTPLTALQGSHYLLKRTLGNQVNPKQSRYLDLQSDSIANLCELTNQVRLYNSMEFGTLKLGLQEDTPIPILMDLVTGSNDLDAKVRVTFSSLVSPDFKLWIERKSFVDAVTNLISNAVKYSKENNEVIVSAAIEKSQFCIKVTDSGRGIPAKEQARLFEAFFRASNVGTVPGTGLGLALVKRLMILHAGTIDFDSQEGLGTTFQLRFPISDTDHTIPEYGQKMEAAKL